MCYQKMSTLSTTQKPDARVMPSKPLVFPCQCAYFKVKSTFFQCIIMMAQWNYCPDSFAQNWQSVRLHSDLFNHLLLFIFSLTILKWSVEPKEDTLVNYFIWNRGVIIILLLYFYCSCWCCCCSCCYHRFAMNKNNEV